MLQEGVSVLFLRRPLTSLVKGKIWESCGGFFLGGPFLEKPDDLHDCEPETRKDVSVVPALTGVPVSPCSVVTDRWDGVSLRIFGICCATVLFFL